MTLYIDGAWIDGAGAPMTSRDLADGTVLYQGHAADSAQVDAAFAAAANAFEGWALTPFDERVALVRRFADILSDRKADMARLIARETGKALWDATGEAGAMVGKVDISLKAYDERTPTREAVNGAVRTRLTHRPHGVMAVFGPYNFPGHLPNGHIVPALIAGNTVVFKPSELTPAVAVAMIKAWEAAGLPRGVLNLVQGEAEVGKAMVASDAMDGLLFTGSASTGRLIARQLADRPEVIQALEMGGNNPLIVHGADDLTTAAVLTVQSAFVTSGQRCTCARRLIVPEGAAGDAFIERLTAVIRGVSVGFWSDTPEPFMGPLIGEKPADAVIGAQDDLIARGADALVRAERDSRSPAMVSPGLLDVTPVSARGDGEVFGPLLQVIRVADFDAAIREANNTRFGLSAGLISDDPALYDHFHPRIRAGIVNWNQPLTGAASTAPFGGIGHSGNHRPSAYYAADYSAFPVASLEQAEDRVAVAAMPQGIKL
ncbi:succinylglutamate-semialdehyde dehydrogenase [Yunchengibacter salinarum]|uniref:succinylglutamate-semialdehyde dehydrogenase n=1 Tax=Yunchengibacter salinarum TaxID=3133399 RepID=UPI0035B661E9